MFYSLKTFRYAISEADGYFLLETNVSSSLIHGVMVYHGAGQGITAYHDGSKIGTDTDRISKNHMGGNGNVEIGRRVIPAGSYYASAYVDEIKMYNRQLSDSEIQSMY